MVKDRGQPRRRADGGVRHGPRADRDQPRAILLRLHPVPFFGYNRDGAQAKEGVTPQLVAAGDDGWRPLAHYCGIAAFSGTDFTEDLKAIAVPTLVMHGEDDQVVPFATTGQDVGATGCRARCSKSIRLSARHAHDQRRRHQRRPARLHRKLKAGSGRNGARGRCEPAARCSTLFDGGSLGDETRRRHADDEMPFHALRPVAEQQRGQRFRSRHGARHNRGWRARCPRSGVKRPRT